MVFRFLNRLNESFSALRSQIISMELLSQLDKVTNMVLREESQGSLLIQSNPATESSNMIVIMDNKQKNKANLVCSDCGKKGHLKEKCYRIIQFPKDFKFTKRKGNYK